MRRQIIVSMADEVLQKLGSEVPSWFPGARK